LHGIERTRKLQGPPEADNGVSRISIRYSGGRVLYFVPDAGGDVFSEDDMLKLQEILAAASSTSEWAGITKPENA